MRVPLIDAKMCIVKINNSINCTVQFNNFLSLTLFQINKSINQSINQFKKFTKTIITRQNKYSYPLQQTLRSSFLQQKMQKDVSQSIISLFKPTSKSVLKSERDLTQSKKLFEHHNNSPTTILQQSISNIPKKSSNQLKWVQKSRQSVPYRLQIKKISNIPSISKKSNSNILFLHFTIKTYLKRQRDNVTEVQLLGEPCHYQCEESLFKREQNKYEYLATFYYHSKINKNDQAVFLSLSMKLMEMRNGVVENSHNVGFFIVQNPFAQNQQRGLYVCKEQINDIQYVEYANYKEMCKGSQGAMIDYEIVSAIQLKKLIKLVPENMVITTHSQVAGVLQEFLPNDHEINQIIESSHLNLKIKYLQVHIPNSFEDSILATIKSYPNKLAGAKDEIKARKIIFGLLSGKNLINPQQKKLQFVQREDAGEFKVAIYQGLKDGQFLTYPYYVEQKPYPVVFCLVYEINDKQVETAYFPLQPIINVQSHDISEQMIMNPHQLCPISRTAFVKSSSKHKPTLITEYMSQQILMEDESFIEGMKRGVGMKSSQSLIRSSHKLIQDKAQQMKEKDKLMQDIEYEKMCLQKQRNEIQKLKNQNYVMYQEEFQKRFEIEREALARRQQMLQNQYREQVEREIREKYQLQDQIKQMKEKVMKIQQQHEERTHNPNQYRLNDSHQGNLQPVHVPGSFMNTQHRSPFAPQNYNEAPFMQRQKIDPSYLLQTQNNMPVTKVRQLIHAKNKLPINKQLIELSKNQYHQASKFTFTFTSVLWNDQVSQPKQIYFVIRFFNFGEYRTDRLTCLEEGSEQGYCQLVRVHQYNCGNDDFTPNYTFTVDPSQFKNPKNIQSDLVSYLCYNNCIVDIFDGSTHIYLGQFNIKLSQLLRGTKSQIFIAKEYNLVKIKTKQHLGAIQVLVKHQQAMCKNELFQTKTSVTVKEEKKKVISYAPMVIPKQQNNENLGRVEKIPTTNKNITANRAEQRIKQFKQRQQQKKLSDVSSNFTVLSQHQKQNTLASITQYKQKNMNEYIKTIYSSLLHENITINAEFGKAQTFPYTFVNQSTTPSAYKIVIDWNANRMQEEPNERGNECDLDVVKEASEWRYYVKKKGYMEPKFYEIINDSNVFYLNPGEHLTMVFKYLTFKPVPKYHSEQILINVSIVKIDSNWIAGGFSLNVQLHQQIVHHSYVLYEPGNQLIELVMPVIYTKDEEYGPGAIKKLYLTDNDEETEAQWINEYEILLKVLTPEIMQRKTFNILLYDDEYFDQLKENWLIVLHSYEGVWAQCRMDYSTKIKIALPMSIIPHNLGFEFNSSILSNYLKLNSSDNSIRFQNDRILAEFSKMREGGAFEIWCQILSSKGVKKQIEVTCTSEQSSGLIYGWIVQVFPYSAKRN